MTDIAAKIPDVPAGRKTSQWQDLWRKEDWWAIWLGLGIVIVAYAFFASGTSLRWIAVAPTKWSTVQQLGGAHFADNLTRYAAQFVLWLALFSVATAVLGRKPQESDRRLCSSTRCPLSFPPWALGTKPRTTISSPPLWRCYWAC